MEKAKKLFEKRVGANTSDGHDDITDDEEYMEEIIKSKKGTISGWGGGVQSPLSPLNSSPNCLGRVQIENLIWTCPK